MEQEFDFSSYSNIKRMSEDELETLWKGYLIKKDKPTRDVLIVQYIYLVRYVVSRVKVSLPITVSIEDIAGYGVEGLMDAVERYSPQRNTRFETYALIRIRGAILDKIRSQDFLPRSVRKKIKEVHGEDIGKKPIFTLLCDGNSLLKVCMKDSTVNTNGEHIGGVFQFLVQLKKLMNQRDWDYVYCFFDDTYSGILRYNIYPEYKANRGKHYEDFNEDDNLSDYMREYNARLSSMTQYFKKKKYEKDVKEKKEVSQEEIDDANFQRERARLMEYFNEIYIRWIMDENGTEADDLIAYYIKHKKPEEKIVIVSTDMDLTQLISDDVYIYNPHLHKNVTSINFKREFGYPYQNVVTKKILCGDTSDNISNISLLSEKKLFEMVPEIKDRPVSVEEVIQRAKELIEARVKEKKKPLKVYDNIVNGIGNKSYGNDFYKLNRKLVDLSEPMLTEPAEEELNGMMYAVQDSRGRSFKNLYKLVLEDGISEIMDENRFSSFFSSFRPLAAKEENRFKNFLENERK